MATISPLRRRMIEDMTIRNLSRATQQSYIYAVAKFSRHFNCPPDRLGMEDVRAYQLHLIDQKYSWSHINQVGVRIAVLLRHHARSKGGVRADRRRQGTGEASAGPQPDEIVRFLEAVTGLRNRVALTTAYAAGLRVGEVVRLKIASIDSEPDVDPHRGRQGWQGSLRDAVAAAPEDPPRLLAAGPAELVAVSGPGARRSCEHRRSSVGVSLRKAACPDRQACDGPLAAAQLCHPPSGERHRHPDHPGRCSVTPIWRRPPATPRSRPD